MSLRSNGSYIGPRPTGPTNGIAGVASGIWDLRTAQRQRAAGTWPFPLSSPTQITGLQLWLDASDASTLYDATTGGSLVAADGAVARWEDKSGSDRHATQGTAGSRPLRKTSIQNGLDVMRFDGSDDSLSVPSSTSTFKFLHSSDHTVFAVFSTASANAGNSQIIFSTYNTSSAEIGARIATNDTSPANDDILYVATRGVSQQFAILNTVSGGFPSNAFAVASFVNRPADGVAADRSSFRRNSGAASTNNSSTQSVSTSDSQADFTIGIAPVLSLYAFDGDICEIIIYNSALSDTDREAVENYLLAKWGIT